jgi:hypothetical protein
LQACKALSAIVKPPTFHHKFAIQRSRLCIKPLHYSIGRQSLPSSTFKHKLKPFFLRTDAEEGKAVLWVGNFCRRYASHAFVPLTEWLDRLMTSPRTGFQRAKIETRRHEMKLSGYLAVDWGKRLLLSFACD